MSTIDKSENNNVVLLAGFANSGKSALVDLLSEVETYFYYPSEPRFITDPDGIMSLESSLVDNWNLFQSDVAIKRFIKLIKRLSNKYCYPYFWKSLKNSFSNEFYEISIEYINNLIDFSYRGMWIGINNPIYKVFWKINLSFNMRILKYSKPIYVSCSQESFISITREYFEKLISRTLHKGKVILNEPFSSLNAKKVLKYFNSARMIIVHRDPRDSYCNLKNETSDFFPKDVEQYIKLYKYMLKQSYKNAENDDRVLRINFEDLVFKYEETKNKVFNFLGIDKSHHIDKFKHFNPEISKKNVKIWKNHPNKDEINKIFNELKEYCY